MVALPRALRPYDWENFRRALGQVPNRLAATARDSLEGDYANAGV